MAELSELEVSAHIKAYDRLDAEKGTMNNVLQELVDFVLPNKSHTIRHTVTIGQRRGAQRFDDTAVHANEMLAANLHGTMTPQTQQWFKLRLREKSINDQQEVAEWLDDCGERMYDVLSESNFNTQVNESYLDLGGFGTMGMSLQEKAKNAAGQFTGVIFKNWPIAEYVFKENEEGRVDTIYRKFKLTAYEASRKWPGKDLGDKVMSAANSENVTKRFDRFDFLHVIVPRLDRDPNKVGSDNMPFASFYISYSDKTLIEESGFQELPIFVARWLKASDDKGWGRGPGMTALPTIRSVNKFREYMLKAGAKDVDPPVIAENKGVVGNIRTHPSGVTYVKRNARLEHWKSEQRLDFSQYNLEDMREQIKGSFFVDQLIPPQDPQMTLGEFLKRVEMMQRLMGPVLGRIVSEFLSPMIFRLFNIMLRAGAFKPAPQALATEDATTLDIEYTSPLARAQKMGDIESTERLYAQTAGIAQATGDQSVFDNLDNDAAVALAHDRMGVPSTVLRDKDERDSQRQQRAQQQQLQQGMDMGQQVSEIDKNLATAK